MIYYNLGKINLHEAVEIGELTKNIGTEKYTNLHSQYMNKIIWMWENNLKW